MFITPFCSTDSFSHILKILLAPGMPISVNLCITFPDNINATGASVFVTS
jgi:hypothetical protein